MQLKNKKFLFLGDSITEGHGTSGEAYTFWGVLGRQTGAICRGYGIGGTRIARQLHPDGGNWDRYFLSRVPEMEPEADGIVVFGGTNDYGHGDAPLGVFTDRTDDTFYGAMHNLCRALIEKYPEAVIVICTPTHRYRAGENPFVNERGLRREPMEKYIAAEREVAAYYSLPVCDLWNISGIAPEIEAQRTRYMPDGLHPNDAGHARIAARLRGFLEAL